MYTNGLKDRFGSPLLSKKDADALYFDKESSENLQSDFTSHVGDTTHLTTEDRTLLSDLANNGSKSYDWTPNTDIKIQFSLANDYTTPVNGWLVINSNTTDDNQMWSFTVNGKQLFNSDQRGNLPVQILLSKNDVISTDSTTNRSCYFLPCKSEVLDYRVTKTPYDIWANAVVEDENGNLSIQNLHVPDASLWTSETPDEVKKSIVRVEDEVAYDEDNNLVCNIQSSEIVNGSNVFQNCLSLTSFSGDLSSLTDGTGMFAFTNLTSFSEDLSNLTNGSYMFYETNITSFSGDLSNLTNGSSMFFGTALTSFSGDLSSLTDGSYMFSGTALTSFSEDLSSLTNGINMFSGTALTSFSGDLSNLTNGSYMFNSTPINQFSGDLSSLTTGNGMFDNCANLTSFSSDLSNLTNGSYMFRGCSNLTSFDVDLSNLTNGTDMFSGTALTSFSEDLSSLTNGSCMFFETSLTSFSGDLSSLTNGSGMFFGCSLDADSVRNIALTINNEVTDNPKLTLGVDTSILTNTQTKNDFGVIIYKGWDLKVNNSSRFDYTPWSSQKYSGCTNVSSVKAVDSNYKTADVVDGKWTEHLCDLEQGGNGKIDGGLFYNCTALTSFSGDLSSLVNGNRMFQKTSLTSFSEDLSNLTDGSYMFFYSSLESFSGDLSNLVNGRSMFYGTKLTQFSGDLSNLENGTGMFNYAPLESFSGDLSSLTVGSYMFAMASLTSFSEDLSNLVEGVSMFIGNPLTSFNSNLSNLTEANFMFKDCKLNTESIKCIAETIKDVTEVTDIGKRIEIGIGNTTPTEEEQGYFNIIASKDWIVDVNGSTYTPTGVASVMTLDEDGNEVETPIPYYAKPIASDEEHAEYMDANGNYFNIVGAQFIYGDDLSTYGMFTCEEDAAINMGLTKIDK